MSQEFSHAHSHLQKLLKDQSIDELRERLSSDFSPLSKKVPGGTGLDESVIDKRWDIVPNSEEARKALNETCHPASAYKQNIENYIGSVQVPVGLVGPLRVNGIHSHGDYYIPLATTEAALVASYHRGAILISENGGCRSLPLSHGVTRAPGFVFETVTQVGEFIAWVLTQKEELTRVAEKTTNHGKLVDMDVTVEGNHVYLCFQYHTADAAGQNMVTIATAEVCRYIMNKTPVAPRYHFVEANLSGDKKASVQSFQSVRGHKVTAEVILDSKSIKRRLHTDAKAMEEYWRMSALGGVLSGTIGVQGHYANGLAALFLATGQDVACVSEASVGVTRFERLESGDLYAAVTLPNLILGTVGGGTGLPTQSACLDVLGLKGNGKATALAEVAAAVALAGELSIIGALAAGHFAKAHEKLARSDRPQ